MNDIIFKTLLTDLIISYFTNKILKPIILKSTTKPTSVFQREINNLIKKIDEVNTEKEFIKCIEALKKGNESKIPDLIKNSELIILRTIIQFDNINIPIERVINVAKKALTKLAYNNLRDKESDIYLRFCAFTVKQSILKYNEINPNS